MKLGIIGGGQLAQLLALSADPLGIEVNCLTKSADMSAKNVCKILLAQKHEKDKIIQFAQSVDVVTYESENIDAKLLELMSTYVSIYPRKESLMIAQDRILEKQLFSALEIPTTEFYAIHHQDDVSLALKQFGGKGVLKTRRFGYDGKGQWLLPQELPDE